jgi:hypothetical protein
LSQYYYLVASLPLLFYDSENFPSREDFLVTCRQHIGGRHYRLLESASTTELHPTVPSCKILDRWRQWEIALRNELVRLRAKKRGRDEAAYLLDSRGMLASLAPRGIAREAFSQDSPLQAEDTLNRGRWSFLDELEVGHDFDIEKILIYALRLQVLARKALFDEKKGREMFDTVYSEIMSPVGEN